VYALANGFLDGLARWRRRTGLPALSVGWGAFDGPGMTAELLAQHPDRAIDVTALDADLAFDLLDMLRTSPGSGHVVIASGGLSSRTRPDAGRGSAAAGVAPESRDVRAIVESSLRALLHRPTSALDTKQGLTEMGVDSLGALDLRGRLQSALGVDLPVTLVFEAPCVDDLVEYLQTRVGHRPAAVLEQRTRADDASGRPQDVAVIGAAVRFPGASSLDELWDMLMAGRDAVREVPRGRWEGAVEVHDVPTVRRAAFLDDVDSFDHALFGISPREATSIDPRQRLLLELAWDALENAGFDPAALRNTDTGVFIGADEFMNEHLRRAGARGSTEPYLATGTTLSFAAGRLSYKLGLQGPSLAIATSCSSSLVALHQAVRSLRSGECGTALVGGAKLMLESGETAQLSRMGALAPDGTSKAFSAAADGYGRGEGGAVLVLRRLADAVEAGDPILAVVRGSAINHDGPSSGLTVPSAGAQVRVIRAALRDADVDPGEVDLLESHGTGTELGDPIELRALAEVFADHRTDLLVGSVKANLGHLEEAAGLTGVAKTMLVLQRGVVPPQIHCDELTPHVAWDDLPFRIARSAVTTPVAVAGVSSFGMSGTNAHVVLAAAPRSVASGIAGPFVFPLSARSATSLAQHCAMLAGALEGADVDPAAVAFTLQTGRRAERFRHAVVASTLPELCERLRGLAARPQDVGLLPADTDEVPRDVVGWVRGEQVDWAAHWSSAPRRVALPPRPMDRVSLRPGGIPSLVSSDPTAAPNSARDAPVETETFVHAVQPTAAEMPGTVRPELRGHVASLLGMRTTDVHDDMSLHDLGADSMTFMRLSRYLRDVHGLLVPFQHLVDGADTITALAA
ncbi:MAG TPA: beta-ketoacyl synthase N-terminal-like domain-containing protein, partial [Cellulomonas sp.]|nr:beta-ketoacyl synthase N-terminal-like domain-containing protein [Cellulomonas sp.]